MLKPARGSLRSDTAIRLLGYGAASLTTLSFFPQALKVLRSGDTGGSRASLLCAAAALAAMVGRGVAGR